MLERATGQGWSLKRLREKVLKTAAGILARSGWSWKQRPSIYGSRCSSGWTG